VIRALLAPRLLGLHALAIAATVVAVFLGLWQYDAWQIHREDRSASLVNAAPKPLASVMSSDAPFPGEDVGRPITLTGQWLPDATVYVADRFLESRRGVWAVTPVAVCPQERDATACAKAPAMLVVRGWAPAAKDVPAPPTGAVEVTGWLQPGEGAGLADPDPGDDVIPEMRIADAIQHLDQDLYGAYVVAREVSTSSTTGEAGSTTGEAGSTTREAGLEPVTPESLPKAPASTGLRNLLYAIEWWVFGGFAVFLWWRFCRDELERDRTAGLADAAPAEPAEHRVNEVTGVPSGP
jgi:surfeit locus 1 family protein